MILMKIPGFVRKWAKENKVDEDDVLEELAYGSDWEEVAREFESEDKYNNVFSVVLKHPELDRYVRIYDVELPYGITDYGMCPMGEYNEEIEEVFPVEVRETKWLTAKERKQQQKR